MAHPLFGCIKLFSLAHHDATRLLLRIEYDGLTELSSDGGLWRGIPVIGAASPARREAVLGALLDHLRSVLAIDAVPLTDERTRSLAARVAQTIREPWAFDERERLRAGSVALLPGVAPDVRDRRITLRLSARSSIGRYLRSRRTWDLDRDLDSQAGEELAGAIIAGGHHGCLRDGVEPVRRRSRVDPLALRGRLGSGCVRSIAAACYRGLR